MLITAENAVDRKDATVFFQQVHAFLEAGQAVEARADRQNRDERPADIVAGHGKHGHSQLGAHYAAGRDDEHDGRVCVADVREERDLLLLELLLTMDICHASTRWTRQARSVSAHGRQSSRWR